MKYSNRKIHRVIAAIAAMAAVACITAVYTRHINLISFTETLPSPWLATSKSEYSIGFEPYDAEKFDQFACLEEFQHEMTLPDAKTSIQQPYDYYLVNGVRRNDTVLFLISQDFFNAIMDRHLVHLYCGARSVAGSKFVHLWGPGMPGWSENRSFWENVESRFGAGTINAVAKMAYGDIGIPPRDDRRGAIFASYEHEIIRADHGAPVNWSHYEHNDIFLGTYENDVKAFFNMFKNENGAVFKHQPTMLAAHWPHGFFAGSMLKFPRVKDVSIEREYDFCLFGSTHARLYPKRAQVEQWINNNTFEKYNISVAQYKHVGYTEKLTQEARKAKGIDPYWLEMQYEHYLEFLLKCRSALVTQSIRKLAVRKYVETMGLGCRMIGDVPPEREAMYKNFVDVPANDTIEGFVEEIRRGNSDPNLFPRLRNIQRVAFQQWSYSSIFGYMLNVFDEYRSGTRGLLTDFEYLT